MQDERVVGIIPSARTKTGMFSSKTYTLVFTTRRLILAEMTDALVMAEFEHARAAAKAAGKGFVGQWGAQLRTSFAFGSQYLAADPDSIMAETPGNTALSATEIRNLAVDRRTRAAAGDTDDDTPYLRVTIQTAAGKHDYDTNDERPSLAEARGLVATLLSER